VCPVIFWLTIGVNAFIAGEKSAAYTTLTVKP